MKGIRKSIVMNNPKMRALAISVDGTAGTPEASGLDASQISSVVDNGTGDYTVILKYPFNPAGEAFCIPVSKTVSVMARVTAVDHDRVTIECTNTATGAATDADLDLLILGNDGRITY